jgi:hypothetical protein
MPDLGKLAVGEFLGLNAGSKCTVGKLAHVGQPARTETAAPTKGISTPRCVV